MSGGGRNIFSTPALTAAQVATQLRAFGFDVTNTLEGTPSEDGMVEITKTVHVQVPTYGGALTVVAVREDGCFVFGQGRSKWSDVVADLRAKVKS